MESGNLVRVAEGLADFVAEFDARPAGGGVGLPGAAELYLEGADGPEPNKITEPFAEKEREEFAQARAKATGHSVELLRPLVHRVMERELREKKA